MEDGALPRRTGMGKAAEAWFELDTEPASVQRIVPPGQGERFEGVAFSRPVTRSRSRPRKVIPFCCFAAELTTGSTRRRFR
jgi:hypothetical protein